MTPRVVKAGPREGLVTRWLRTAPASVFTLYGGLAAFGTYFSMYAYRKPFTAAAYAGVVGWPFAVDFKVALVIAQLVGYALSKIVGIKVIAEMPAANRAAAILLLVGTAEVSLVLFALAPPAIGVAMLFVNGLMLGLIWGLVFGFIEGRRLADLLGAMLCASFIVSSGVVKSAGAAVMAAGWAGERWMPAATGALFAPLLVLSVWALAQLPPPNARDEAERAPRACMIAADRKAFLRAHAAGLAALIVVYVMLTAVRDFRDNFAAEIWAELGYSREAGIFTWSELPVAAIVLVVMATLVRLRDNRRAVAANLALIATGLLVLGLATIAFWLGAAGPVAWMIAVGAGLYLAYVPFNALLFDRLMAATAATGNAGFLIYLADACGYASSVALLVLRTFAHITLHWSSFLAAVAAATCVLGLFATIYATLRLHNDLRPAGLGNRPDQSTRILADQRG